VTHDELVDKYPKILNNARGYPGVGKGWLPLIDALCRWLQFNTDNNSHIEAYAHQVEAVQIKEKFGTLRFYVNGASDVQHAAISFAESMSGHICEECGAPGKRRGKEWIRTLCDEHNK
jgi:hypothetical protein